MSVTDSTSVIQLKKVGSLLPALSVDFEQLLEHLKELKKEDPEKYAEMNALFNSCRAAEEEDEEEEPDCGVCYEKTRSDGRGRDANIGCCDGCHIRVMCKDCGVWDEEEEVWRCPDCQDYHENQKHDKQPPACQTCKKPCWSDDDEVQFVIHGCAVCKECFDEHEEEHALEKKINLTTGA